MEIITSHTNADFDSLAGMVAAQKIYPNAVLAFPGSADAAVREYLLANHWLTIKHAGDINIQDVKKLVLVDTREAHRLGDFRELIEKPGIEIHTYDHHPSSYRDIVGEKNVIKPVGSSTTIFVEMIREKKISITSEEATLFCIGIYVDTGSLAFVTTTDDDVKAANWLIEQGADLKKVGEWLNRKLTDEQERLLSQLKAASECKTIEGHPVLIATASLEAYVDDLAVLMYRLGDFEKISAAFSVVRMGERIYLVGRSANPNVNVGEILIEMGGGGHSTAASACVKGTDVEKVKKQLVTILKKKIRPAASETFAHPAEAAILKIDDWAPVPKNIVELLKRIGDIGNKSKFNVFVVGGFVRDLLLKIKDLDLDLVVEGEGIAFARILADKLGGSFFSFEKFGTASVMLPNRQKIDVATARKEFYARPAALPEVVGTSIKQDLLRRDFSINGMAIKLNPPDFGRLIDFFNGQRDLQHGVIRVLHNLSFIDDPTRIFRAVRFEQRYGFRMESHTEKLLKDALKEGVIKHLSMERVSAEIVLILSEKDPIPALKRMRELHIFSLIHPDIKLSNKMLEIMEEIPRSLSSFEAESWVVYAITLFSELPPKEVNKLLSHLRFSANDKQKFSVLFLDWKKILQALGRTIRPSVLSGYLEKISAEGFIFLYAVAKNKEIRNQIKFYWTFLRKVKPLLSGEDLLGLGMKPGPKIGILLDELKKAQLDGVIKTKDKAKAFVKEKTA